MQSPLDKVVFIQQIAAFASNTFATLVKCKYVNQSWSDTIQNYSFHSFEQLARANDYRPCEKVLESALKCNALWLLNSLLSKYFLETKIEGTLLFVVKNSSSPEVIKFFLKKIAEVGGIELQKNQISSSEYDGTNVLMSTCCNDALSPELLKVVIDAIVEVGGSDELLKNQLEKTTDGGLNCLCYTVCQTSCAVLELILDTIVKVCGPDLLRSQFSAHDRCLMLACRQSSLTKQMLEVLFEKMVEVGGNELLASQLITTDSFGRHCLANICEKSENFDVLKFMVEKITEVAGADALKNQLSANKFAFPSILMLMCKHWTSIEAVQFILNKIVEVGGPTLLQSQLVAKDMNGCNCLIFIGMVTAKSPSFVQSLCKSKPFSCPEVTRLVAALLHHFDLFKEQYENLSSKDVKAQLKIAGINDAKWIPDAGSKAIVRKMLN